MKPWLGWMSCWLQLAALAWPVPANAAPPAPVAATASPSVVLKAARLFDGKSERLLQPAVIVVTGGKITSLGANVAIPAGAEVIDLGDTTLLAGFIDAHTHLTGEGGDNWYKDEVDQLRRSVPATTIEAVDMARRTLLGGVTSVRNVGSEDFVDVALRDGISAGRVLGPRMLTAAHSIGARGGHCDTTGYPLGRFGAEPGIEAGIASGADQFRDAVRMQIKYGADVIKVCATGGVLSLTDEVDTPQVTQDEMNSIVAEAHRLRRKTAAHAHGASGAKVAIRAGIDSIEHGTFLDDEALLLMRQRGVVLVPTAMAIETVRRRAPGYPPEIAVKALAAAKVHGQMLRRAFKLGVKIAFGTDAGVYAHGKNAGEFGLLVRNAGMTPLQALKTTLTSAELLGIDKLVGSLEVGKQADIVAVPGNPLADVSVTERVLFVMKGGKVYRNDRRKSPGGHIQESGL